MFGLILALLMPSVFPTGVFVLLCWLITIPDFKRWRNPFFWLWIVQWAVWSTLIIANGVN